MDLLLKICEEKKAIVKTEKLNRSKSRNMLLLKMYSMREILKWKYNYFESNPYEHRKFLHSLEKFKVNYKSFEFKQKWRLEMDQLFYEETQKLSTLILAQQMKKIQRGSETGKCYDPKRLLINYDRKVVKMIQKVKNDFNNYLRFPKLYPNYREEMKTFLALKFPHVYIDEDKMTSSMAIENAFKFYWESRISDLCDRTIAEEKQTLIKNWKNLMPIYNEEEVRGLLSDEDSDKELEKYHMEIDEY